MMARVRSIPVAERRRLLVHGHHLAGDATGPDDVTDALLALHATEPASVHLSVLARSRDSTLADVSAALYDRRSLVRWTAMRRTLFVFPRADVPLVHAAVGPALSGMLRRQLVSRLTRNGTEPALDTDADRWLAALEDRVADALTARGTATGAQLSADVPAMRTVVLPGAPSEQRQNVTSPLLTLMGTQGRIVRGDATGAWTTRSHRWEPVATWWPDGLPALDESESQRELARRYLEGFGPCTVDDVQWWTGWTKTATRRALDALPLEQVDLHGEPGIALEGESSTGDVPDAEPVAALLPTLDPTPMGWKRRDWFLGLDPRQIFDRAGNIGPTVWWDGEVVGSWGVAAGGEVRTVVPVDRGAAATAAIADAAATLQSRLDGAVVSPGIRVPLRPPS